MEIGNNLQMIQEQDGENNFNNTQDMQEGQMQATGGTQVQQIENDINLIQQQQQISSIRGDSKSGRMVAAEYQDDEEDIICARFPHLDVCACEISSDIALKEINLFQVYPGIYMGPF